MSVTIDEERIAFYYELGVAIREWARVERAMYEATAACFPREPEMVRNVLARGYVVLPGFHAKWLFTHNAMDRTLVGRAELSEWEALSDRLRTKSDQRNKLVHNTVKEFPGAKPGRRIASCPWTRPKGIDTSKPWEGCECLIGVVKIRMEFEALTASIENFVARASKQPEPHPKSAERPGNPLTLRPTVLRIHAALGHPQQSSKQRRLAASAANAAASLATPVPEAVNEPDPETPDPAGGRSAEADAGHPAASEGQRQEEKGGETD